jgi:hypothetical protein
METVRLVATPERGTGITEDLESDITVGLVATFPPEGAATANTKQSVFMR